MLIAFLLKTFACLKNEAGLPYIVSSPEYKAIYDCFTMVRFDGEQINYLIFIQFDMSFNETWCFI